MIPHPGIELALARNGGDRAKARAHIRAIILAEAYREAARAGLSRKCEKGEHTDSNYGCANDGSGCICECHD